MANDNLKTVKELVEIIKHKIDMLEMGSRTQITAFYIMKDQQSVMNEKLDNIEKTLREHTDKLDSLAGDMEQVLTELKSTHDEIGLWHQRDKRELDEIKTHLNLPLIPDSPQ